MPRKAKASKTEPVKNLEELDLEESPQQQQMSPEAMEKFWRVVHEADKKGLSVTLENVDKLYESIISALRSGNEATSLLRDAEDIMYDLDQFVSRHRYTFPHAIFDYSHRNVNLSTLAEINQLVVAGLYPIAEG